MQLVGGPALLVRGRLLDDPWVSCFSQDVHGRLWVCDIKMNFHVGEAFVIQGSPKGGIRVTTLNLHM